MFQIFQRNPLKRQQSVMRPLSSKSHTDFPWEIENTIYIAKISKHSDGPAAYIGLEAVKESTQRSSCSQ